MVGEFITELSKAADGRHTGYTTAEDPVNRKLVAPQEPLV